MKLLESMVCTLRVHVALQTEVIRNNCEIFRTLKITVKFR